MSRLKQFKLPDLGEGLTEGEILQWMVKPGDEVTLNQPIVEVETAKAAVEVPSPYAGVVHEIHHAAGETVDVGSPIITFDTEPGAGPLDPVATTEVVAEHPEIGDLVPTPPAVPAVPAPPAEGFVEPGLHAAPTGDASGPLGALIGEVGPSGRTATLVGYGPKSVTAKRRARSDSGHATPVVPAVQAPPPPPPATAARVSAAAVGQSAAQSAGAVTVLAKPPVRKLAKELGVDLPTVVPTGPNGSITRADVESAGLRHRPNQGRRAVGEPAINRLLYKDDAGAEVAILEVDRVYPKEAHPLAIVDRNPTGEITDWIKLESSPVIQ